MRWLVKPGACGVSVAARTGASGRVVRWPGMMLHQDASRHAWLSDRPALDLVVTMDDDDGHMLEPRAY